MNDRKLDLKRDSVPHPHLRDLNQVYLDYTKNTKK